MNLFLVPVLVLQLFLPADTSVEDSLVAAVRQGQLPAVQELLAANPDLSRVEGGQSLLMMAVEQADLAVISLLLEKGAPLDRVTASGSVLHHCVLAGRVGALSLFLSRKANPNAVNDLGRTPLMLAAQENETWIARLLLGAGAEVNQQDVNGDTALHFAVLRGNLPLIDLLLRHQANPKLANQRKQTPLLLLGLTRFQPALDLFLRHNQVMVPGQRPKLQAETIDQSIWALARNGQLEDLKKLPVSDLGATRDNGWNLLLESVSAGRLETVTFLLDSGADPDQAHAQGRTPLGQAVSRGDSAMIRLLQRKGAKVLGLVDNKSVNTPKDADLKLLTQLYLQNELYKAPTVADPGIAPQKGVFDSTAPGIALPQITRRVEPVLPLLGKKPERPATVVLRAIFSREQNVYNVQVIQAAGQWGYGLEAEAIRSLHQWEWSPGLREGQPISVQMNLNLTFSDKAGEPEKD